MIAKLSGRLDSIGPDWAVVDVGGVGYLVYCSARTLHRLGAVGSAVALAIETHVREDHIHLYGFADAAERSWFRLLLTVQGVGARVAMAILDALSLEQLVLAISAQDRAALTRADGVGPKLATRILIELKDRTGSPLAPTPTASVASATTPAPDQADDARRAAAEAVSALVNLGYGRSEAVGAVAAAGRWLGADADLPALIRTGLKELGPREVGP